MSSLPDTGARTKFSTGAVRDASVGKGFPHMIPSIGIRKIAQRFEDGAKKYGPNNWMKGIPLSRYQDAIIRHLGAWAEGQTDEDHLGAVGRNMVCAAWTEQEIQAGRLPADLDDLPFRDKTARYTVPVQIHSKMVFPTYEAGPGVSAPAGGPRVISAWLEMLPAGYRQCAIAARARSLSVYPRDLLVDSIGDALWQGINFTCSAEGWNFWSELHEILDSGKPLPPYSEFVAKHKK